MSQRATKRILHIKRLVEHGKRAELAEQKALCDVAEDRVERARKEHERIVGELTRERESSALDLEVLSRHAGQAASVVRKEHALLTEEREREAACRERMFEATRDVKTFEQLDARKLEEKKLMMRRYEQSTLDELGAARRVRT